MRQQFPWLIPTVLAFAATSRSQPPTRLQTPGEAVADKVSAGVLFKMIGVPAIRKPLQLGIDQRKQVKALLHETGKRINDKHHELIRVATDPLATAILQEDIARIVQGADDELKEILTAKQTKQLQSAFVRAQMQSVGISALLTNTSMRELLNLSDRQAKEIADNSPDVLERMQKEIQAVKLKAMIEILGPLTPDQKKTFLEAIGDGELNLIGPTQYKANPNQDLDVD